MSDSSPASHTASQVIAQRIGNYCGYEKSVKRTESDLLLRGHLVKKINGLLQDLVSVRKAAQTKDQERLTSLVESTKRKLKTIGESLEKPTYNGTPFFECEKLPEKRLLRIYNFETDMLSELSSLFEEITGLKGHSMEKAEFEDHFLHIHDFVDNFNQALFGREALILGDE
jgi:hypothetical protein